MQATIGDDHHFSISKPAIKLLSLVAPIFFALAFLTSSQSIAAYYKDSSSHNTGITITPSKELQNLVDNAINISLQHVENSVTQIKDPHKYPTYAHNGYQWSLSSNNGWTAGFYPGILWQAYELSADKRFEKWAMQWTENLASEVHNQYTHNLGFKFMNSYGNALRLSDAIDKAEYEETLLKAASTFVKRYRQNINLISSDWDPKYYENTIPVVSSITMNLDLLIWAAENGGDKAWADYANKHAKKVFADFTRENGSSYHIVRYDDTTGEIVNKGTLKGDGDESSWARGQAWSIYGMVMMYRLTKDREFVDNAVKLTDYFIGQLEPDGIALWDFETQRKHRDVSASAIVASALLELVDYVDNDALRAKYTLYYQHMLTSLCKKPYFINDPKFSPILDQSIHDYTKNSAVGVPAIFADYYFLEALIRFRNKHPKT